MSSAATERRSSPLVGLRRARALRNPVTATLVCAWVVVLAGALWFLFSTHGFATWGNVKAVLAASAFVGIIAAGETIVMVSGSFFSMALGVQAAGSAVFFLWALHLGIVPAFVLTLIVGAAVSGAQGYAIGVWEASPIILTIAAGVVLSGVIVLATNGATVRPPLNGPSIAFLADRVGGISVPAIVMVGVALLMQILLRRTRFGARTYLVGANRAAAHAAGLPVARVILIVFAVAGLCGAVAGIMLSGFQQSASLSLQGTLMFDAIAAVLVGGCSVLGGRGSAIGTLCGTIGISAINSALVLRGYSEGVQILVKGLIVLAAVLGVFLWSRERRQ